MTYILPADFIEFNFAQLVCAGLLTVTWNGHKVIAVEASGDAYWLRGQSGCVKTIIDRVACDAAMEVRVAT